MNKIPHIDVALIKAQATRILKVWKANHEFRMKDATVADFEAVHDKFERVLKDIEAKGRELGELRKARQKAVAKLRELSTRAQSGLRGYFGPNSAQYQQIRGTPTIERKKTRRKARPVAAVGGESTGTKP
jgi:hypothetical protein